MKNKDIQEIRLHKETTERLDTLIDLIRLLLEQDYVKTKMKIHTLERKRLIEEGVIKIEKNEINENI